MERRLDDWIRLGRCDDADVDEADEADEVDDDDDADGVDDGNADGNRSTACRL